MLIKAGFPLIDDNNSLSYYKIDPFSLTVERTSETNISSIKCLNTLFKHSSRVHLDFSTPHKMTILNAVVKKQHYQHLQILLENFLDVEMTRDEHWPELLISVLSQSHGRNNSREMAKLLIKTNCCDYFTKETYPSPLTLAIVYHPSLVRTFLECGVPIWGTCRRVSPDKIPPWLKEIKFRKLYTMLKEADFSDTILAEEHLDDETLQTFTFCAVHQREHSGSLLFHCRKTIRRRLVYCSRTNVEKLDLPRCLREYILIIN